MTRWRRLADRVHRESVVVLIAVLAMVDVIDQWRNSTDERKAP